jgi:hypothetical protein
MPPVRRAVIGFAFAILLAAAPARATLRPGLADSLAALLPDGAVPVDILTPQYSPRIQGIALKIDEARRANPAFFQAWMARHPGGPPPWNPAFGVTRAEYDEYLRVGQRAPYVVRQRARLTFARAGKARRWTLHGWGLLAPLDGVVVDVDGEQVSSIRTGPLPFLGMSAPDEADTPLHWRWFATWKAHHVIGDPAKGGQALQASFHLGPLDDGRVTGLYWVMRRFNGGRRLADEFLLLRFRPR